MAVIRIRAEDEAEFLMRWRRYADRQSTTALGSSSDAILLNPIKVGPAPRKKIKFMEVDRTFLAYLRLDGFFFE